LQKNHIHAGFRWKANSCCGKGRVKVSCLCPGPTKTGFVKRAKAFKLFNQKSIAKSLDVASFGYKSMLEGRVIAIPDFKFRILVQLSRILPRSIVRKISSKVNRGA
jgi:short-subunit dehydrogenase